MYMYVALHVGLHVSSVHLLRFLETPIRVFLPVPVPVLVPFPIANAFSLHLSTFIRHSFELCTIASVTVELLGFSFPYL